MTDLIRRGTAALFFALWAGFVIVTPLPIIITAPLGFFVALGIAALIGGSVAVLLGMFDMLTGRDKDWN